jgi:hypothetical protein
MAKNSRQTGPDAASAAGRTLADPDATQDERSAAASTLSQKRRAVRSEAGARGLRLGRLR